MYKIRVRKVTKPCGGCGGSKQAPSPPKDWTPPRGIRYGLDTRPKKKNDN